MISPLDTQAPQDQAFSPMLVPAVPAFVDTALTPPPPSVQAEVKQWLGRIKSAEAFWKKDFDRIKTDEQFAAGVQRDCQVTLDQDKYVANISLRVVQQKVSALYAKDPTAIAEVRQRMNYVLWDGKPESIALAIQSTQMAMMTGTPLSPQAVALIHDYENGKTQEEVLDKVAETLELFYQWQIDNQEPEFKKQMKQLVRRVVTCGVGYVRLRIESPGYSCMTTDGPQSTPETRLQQASLLVREMSENGNDPDSAKVEQVRQLQESLQAGVDSAATGVSRLLFEFPPSTNIIPDPATRQLKGFVGANWVCERFRREKQEVEAFFEVKLPNTCLSNAAQDEPTIPQDLPQNTTINDSTVPVPQMVVFYEVYNKRSKSRFIVCEGYDGYLVAPEPVLPPTKRFWPWFTLTFNDVEVEHCDDQVASIFPPSDVFLIKHMQKELNRRREASREHRTGSVPFYVAGPGLTNEDKEKLLEVEANQVIHIQGLGADGDVRKALAAFTPAPYNPLLYTTDDLTQDVLMTVGAQDANLGPTSGGDTTATESTIAEQSRISNLASNIDDLDDLLTDLARAGGELLIRVASEDEVKFIVGPGAVWPPADQADLYAQEVVLTIQAASSGRPNKALEVANIERLAPHLIQLGANPAALAKEIIRRLDDKLKVEDFLPLVPSTMPAPAPSTGTEGKPRGTQTTQQMNPAPANANAPTPA